MLPLPEHNPHHNRLLHASERELRAFIDTLFEPSDLLEIRGIVAPDYHRNEPGRLVIRRWVTAGELPALSDMLHKENRDGVNIYFGVNPRAALYSGTKAGIRLCRTVWADMDRISLPDARKRWEALSLPEPTVIVNSGHGIHLYWKLSEPVRFSSWKERAAFEATLKSLYRDLGSDSTQDVTRLLRIPGYLNVKQAPVPCTLVSCKPDQTFPLSLFERWQETEAPNPSHLASTPATGTDLTTVVISERQDIQRIRGLVAILDKDVEDRSRRDFWVICRFVELGLSEQEIAGLVTGKSKFTSESYFRTTLYNAFATVGRATPY